MRIGSHLRKVTNFVSSALVQDSGVGRRKIEDTTVDGMKIDRDDLSHVEHLVAKAEMFTDLAQTTLTRTKRQSR